MEDLSKLTKKELIERLGEVPRETSTVNDYEKEFDKLDRLSTSSNPNQIPFTQSSDHKNMMLYTALNKRVGPLHPNNAKHTMRRWKKAGIQLYTTPRTPEQVEAFKQTPEYKVAHEKHLALRKLRHKQSGKGKTEKMIADVAVAVANAQSGAK